MVVPPNFKYQCPWLFAPGHYMKCKAVIHEKGRIFSQGDLRREKKLETRGSSSFDSRSRPADFGLDRNDRTRGDHFLFPATGDGHLIPHRILPGGTAGVLECRRDEGLPHPAAGTRARHTVQVKGLPLLVVRKACLFRSSRCTRESAPRRASRPPSRPRATVSCLIPSPKREPEPSALRLFAPGSSAQ